MSEHVEGIEEVVLAVNDPEAAVALFEDVFGFRFDQTWEVSADKMKVRCAWWDRRSSTSWARRPRLRTR